MAKRPQIRLRVGGGELTPPGPNARAQWLYLEAVQRYVPEAMRALAQIAPNLPDPNGPFSPARHDQEAPLREWCQQYGFTALDDWLLTVARRTADYLRTKDPAWPDEWVFVTVHRGVGTEHVSPLRWQPDEETETQFRARVETYIGQVKATAGERGWHTAPEKRTLQHLEWLARYQVGGWTQACIAAHYPDSPDLATVSHALKDAADLVGVKLRPPSRGGRSRKPLRQARRS